jgi:hypothetical protein
MVPIAVTGTREARFGRFWRRDIAFRAGEPFRLVDLGVPTGDAQSLADAIMARVAILLPTSVRGIYRDSG